ncbi:hypothetical protein EKK58_02345 [Candidatus Dependentiae bacterium]|nr:MAG: hypothetical protein EKK58_02345 [Candidatus Dependentiae bacterium]
MKILEVLEDRVNKLINMAAELAKKNTLLKKDVDVLKEELNLAKAENTNFAEHNAELITQIKSLEELTQKENKQLHDLSEEKSLAKLVVDDLIKSIDALIERENEQ